MKDRAHQALVKLALEPAWESKFEANSYGFRPGRSCHDAIEAIHIIINHKAKYVWDADLKGCFDNVHHEILLNCLTERMADRRLLKRIARFLKAGLMENGLFQHSDLGVPQGGLCKALHIPPYAKQVTMQRKVSKRWRDGPFPLHSFAESPMRDVSVFSTTSQESMLLQHQTLHE